MLVWGCALHPSGREEGHDHNDAKMVKVHAPVDGVVVQAGLLPCQGQEWCEKHIQAPPRVGPGQHGAQV